MKRATIALIAALVTAMLSLTVSAQTLRLPQDPRNQAPTVGTGGPVGGPTGLFTVYDGDTIRRGGVLFYVGERECELAVGGDGTMVTALHVHSSQVHQPESVHTA